jgi:hypothetical protein
MASLTRIFGITVMVLIILFAIIHLGVSIGIIIPYRKYGDIFRPEIALSAFNIVISFFGFVAGILGFLTVLFNVERFGKVYFNIVDEHLLFFSILAKIVAIVCGVLGLFTLGSLVAAIIINSMSLNYISTHFLNNLNNYKTSADARNNIDLLQYNYHCCGVDIWVDWANIGLGATSPITNGTTTITNTGSTASVMSSTLAQTSATAMTTITPGSGKKKRDTHDVSDNRQQSLLLSDSSRQKRQATSSTYGGINGLSTDFIVTLPLSCCTPETQIISNISSSCKYQSVSISNIEKMCIFVLF